MPGQNLYEQSEAVSQRQSRLAEEIVRLVAMGTEHPTFEFKRKLAYSKDNPAERAEFIKLVQGMANAQPGQERVLVIGADQKNRCFHEVDNVQDFDQARISPVLEAYLNPQPLFECFNSLTSPDGKPYCALVLAADQPRPIVIEKQLDKDGKSYLVPGDIWIKKNTGLAKAARADIEAIYKNQVETEGERLARARFAYMRDEFYASATFNQTSGLISSLASSDAEFSRYVQSLIADGDSSRFLITLEELRDELIERWPSCRRFTTTLVSEIRQYHSAAFVPALRRAVELGLRIVKHNGDPAWLTNIIKLLAEVFEVSRRIQIIAQYSPIAEHQLLTAAPALDAHIGAWCCASYALRRKRYPIFCANNQNLCDSPLLGRSNAASTPKPAGSALLYKRCSDRLETRPYFLLLGPPRFITLGNLFRKRQRRIYQMVALYRCDGRVQFIPRDRHLFQKIKRARASGAASS